MVFTGVPEGCVFRGQPNLVMHFSFFFYMIVSKPSARSDTLVQWLVVAGWEFVKSSVAAQSAGAVIH